MSADVRFPTSWSNFVIVLFAVLNSVMFYLYNDNKTMLISHL